MQICLAITAVIPIYVGLMPFITITFCMVHPRGFEPLTARFVAGYSIQLSYGCKSNTCVSYLSKLALAKTSAFSIAAAGWNGASERIRTSDRSVRSRVLYPAELRMPCMCFTFYFRTVQLLIHNCLRHTLMKYGASERIRTSDRPVRSRVLYPAELRMHRVFHQQHEARCVDYSTLPLQNKRWCIREDSNL